VVRLRRMTFQRDDMERKAGQATPLRQGSTELQNGSTICFEAYQYSATIVSLVLLTYSLLLKSIHHTDGENNDTATYQGDC
jgi:hypothetical protein